MKIRTLLPLLVLAICLSVVRPAAAAEKGWYGFRVEPDITGTIFKPTVRSLTIKKVYPGSPAAEQEIRVGDVILEFDGVKVPGGNGYKVRAAATKTPGETLRLRLKRPGGEIYTAKIVAIKKPQT